MAEPSVMEQVHELELLRHEYRVELSMASDPEKKRRLYRMVQELTACIDYLQQNTAQRRSF
jgi:hypothetical protein